jgi:transaldolase
LWASTSTKNPAYSDTKYIEALIGPETINTMPVETLAAYRDRGRPERRLDRKTAEAYQILRDLSTIGIDLDAATDQLEGEGVEKFSAALDRLMVSLKETLVAPAQGKESWAKLKFLHDDSNHFSCKGLRR